jgi:hypothetical protein
MNGDGYIPFDATELGEKREALLRAVTPKRGTGLENGS